MTRHLSLRAVATAVTLLTPAAGALRAQSTLDTTFTVRANPRLNIQSSTGSVTVRPTGGSQIRVQAEYERARIEFSATGSQVSVRTESRRGHAEVDYTISVPAGTAVEINGLAVDVTISGVCGPLSVSTVSGDIDAVCLDGESTISTISGDISLVDVRGPLETSSTSGDVDLRGARGPVSTHAVSGDVTLSDISGADVDVETVNGDVEYTGRILDNGRYRFAAHSGDVTVRVLGNLNATVSVSTFNGEFSSDFQIEIRPGTHMGNKDWEFRLGNGSARMRLNSFSGSINLQRGSAGGPREE